MATLFGPDAFNPGGVTQNIDAYPSGTPDYAYGAGTGTNVQVITAVNRVQEQVTGTDCVVRVINAAVNTDGNDTVSITGNSTDIGDNAASCAVRIRASSGTGCYVAYMAKNVGVITIYRVETAGAFTSLTAQARSWTNPGTVTFVAVTNGSQVDLTCTPTGAAAVTVSDTNALRWLDGRAGFHMYCDTINLAYLDDLLVTGTGVTPPVNPQGGGFPAELLSHKWGRAIR